MQTHRAVRSVVLTAAMAMSLVACASIHVLLKGRDLTCGDTSQDLCIRVATTAMTELNVPPALASAAGTMTVKSVPCPDFESTATHCWIFEVNDAKEGFGTRVYQNPDGTIVSPK